jgi:hypothetical protein
MEYGVAGVGLDVAEINGEQAVLAFIGETLTAVLLFDIAGEQIAALRMIANPDKLEFMKRRLSHPAPLSGS